jgi:FdhD protein
VAKKKPVLTNATRPAAFEVKAYNERGEMVPTAIAGEQLLHPLPRISAFI